MHPARRNLLAALLLAALLGTACGGGQRTAGSKDGMAHLRDWYARAAPGHEPPPAWVFCLPEKRDTIYGLGFALQHMNGDAVTDQNAFESAIHNLARSIKVSIKAKKYIQTEVTALSLRDQLLIEKESHIDSQVEQTVREKAQQLERWKDMSNGVTWVLAAVSLSDIDELKSAVRRRARCRIGVRPCWLKSPPTDKGVLYGIGEASMHWNPVDSFKEAEDLALVQIVEQIKARVTGFDDAKSSDYEDYTYRIVRIISEGSLSGSDIVARWVDFKTGTAYALARMPLISVKSNILAAARQAEAEVKEEAEQAPEERRARSAAEIEQMAEGALEMMDKALEKNFGPPPAPELPPEATPADDVAPEPEAEAEEAPADDVAPEPGSEAEEGAPTESSPEPEAPADEATPEPGSEVDGGEG